METPWNGWFDLRNMNGRNGVRWPLFSHTHWISSPSLFFVERRGTSPGTPRRTGNGLPSTVVNCISKMWRLVDILCSLLPPMAFYIPSPRNIPLLLRQFSSFARGICLYLRRSASYVRDGYPATTRPNVAETYYAPLGGYESSSYDNVPWHSLSASYVGFV